MHLLASPGELDGFDGCGVEGSRGHSKRGLQLQVCTGEHQDLTTEKTLIKHH